MTEIKEIKLPPHVNCDLKSMLNDEGSHITKGDLGKYIIVAIKGKCDSYDNLTVGGFGLFPEALILHSTRYNMRFEKENYFVEISRGASCDDNHDSVWFVESNIEFKKLPIEFRDQVSTSDLQKAAKLRRVISSWAKEKNFKLIK